MRVFNIALIILGLLAPSSVHGITLDDIVVATAPFPDIFVTGIDYNFDSSSDLFEADGQATVLRTGGVTVNGVQSGFDQDQIFDLTLGAGQRGVFDLDATIDDSGNLLSGAFSISGGIPPSPFFAQQGLNWNSTAPLLTGNLTDVAFDPTGVSDNIVFLFEVTGGAAGVHYLPNTGDLGFGPVGNPGVIAFSGVNDFTGSWSDSFANNSGQADVALPVPGTPSLLLSLAIPLLCRRSRRS